MQFIREFFINQLEYIERDTAEKRSNMLPTFTFFGHNSNEPKNPFIYCRLLRNSEMGLESLLDNPDFRETQIYKLLVNNSGVTIGDMFQRARGFTGETSVRGLLWNVLKSFTFVRHARELLENDSAISATRVFPFDKLLNANDIDHGEVEYGWKTLGGEVFFGGMNSTKIKNPDVSTEWITCYYPAIYVRVPEKTRLFGRRGLCVDDGTKDSVGITVEFVNDISIAELDLSNISVKYSTTPGNSYLEHIKKSLEA